MSIIKSNRGTGWAKVALTASTFGFIAMMAATAAAGPPLSEATKEAVKNGHWGGTYGDVWLPGPYEKPYKVIRPLSEATKARMAKGHWTGGGAGARWQPGLDREYAANPQLHPAARSKLARGHWGGKTSSIWIGPDGKPQ